ncbi:MAG: MaoC family dehydratase N-terminal domain-containing protein [Ardenticatenaceae bacterium]|nr:MaoC family dehydratase N-terminal domain-containing protein [Ardenticatenaceae bacterium]
MVELEKALGYEFVPQAFSYTERDAALYALSVGAAGDPLDGQALRYVYELHGQGFRVLPTFAVTFPFAVMPQILSVPGLPAQPMMILHGEHYLALKRPLPVSATLTQQARISQIYDKGKGALVMLDIRSYDRHGEEVAFNQASMFMRGLGGFGGERGPSSDINLPPDRTPDAVVSAQTQPNQALFYRLTGSDANPLHADPMIAQMVGYGRPILHGLCTLGFAARAVLETYANNDPARFRSVKVRFSKHVFPGETIVTEMWPLSATEIIFQAKAAERDTVVLSNALLTLHEEM